MTQAYGRIKLQSVNCKEPKRRGNLWWQNRIQFQFWKRNQEMILGWGKRPVFACPHTLLPPAGVNHLRFKPAPWTWVPSPLIFSEIRDTVLAIHSLPYVIHFPCIYTSLPFCRQAEGSAGRQPWAETVMGCIVAEQLTRWYNKELTVCFWLSPHADSSKQCPHEILHLPLNFSIVVHSKQLLQLRFSINIAAERLKSAYFECLGV